MRPPKEDLDSVPPWLEHLLTTRFFDTCSAHADSARSERNMFCLDCVHSPAAFCFYCRSETHANHNVIQIRRSSYHDVVRASEVQKVLDISGVQTYVINSARVLFLNERPQPRSGGSNGKGIASQHACEICARSLLDPFRFCSLGCKLVGIRKNFDMGEEEMAVSEGGGGGNVTGGLGDHNVREDSPAHGSRRRKGIPRRAPCCSG